MSIEKLPERLLALRKEKGLTQKELAEKLHYSDKVISKWERGESLPDLEALDKLSSFYKISSDSLIKDQLIDHHEGIRKEEDHIQLEHIQKPSLLLKLSMIPLMIIWLLMIPQGPFIFGLSGVVLGIIIIGYSFLLSYHTWKSSYRGHEIVIKNTPSKVTLSVDNIVVDQSRKIFASGIVLETDVDDKHLKVYISSFVDLKCEIIIIPST